MNNFKLLLLLLSLLFSTGIYAKEGFVPITSRVKYQSEVAPDHEIVDERRFELGLKNVFNKWVATGLKKEYAIGYDYSTLFKCSPSFRFSLKQDDNTLDGHTNGETKGRAELSFCFATADDVSNLTEKELQNEVIAKTVYFHGKGWCKQGSTMFYRFSIYMLDTISSNIHSIFAQWHAMPDRTLLQTPEGVVLKITKKEFSKLCNTMYFVQEKGYNKLDKKPNGWIIHEGGYPPLEFGFTDGFFFIRANSDRKWFSDKTDRCLVNVKKGKVMQPVKSIYKESTLAYKGLFADFPKNKWVTFYVKVEWSEYAREKEDIIKPGLLDVVMSYENSSKTVTNHLVSNESLMIGQNILQGYYFKFGIYRTANHSVPVSYNMANYAEQVYPFREQ